MNIQEIVTILVNSGIDIREANIEVKMLIEHYCNYTALDVIRGVPLNYEKLKIVKEKAEIRARSKVPIQYIIGHAYFMGNKFRVNENVLIPRDETEQLVLRVIDIVRSNNCKRILDIGTGSGCIPCSLAKVLDSEITSVDISSDALQVATENVKALNLEKKVKLIQSDLFSNLQGEKYDLIVSNPPYIPKGTKLQKEVTFEPELALFAEDKRGLEFYKKIISLAPKYLNLGGFIAFEIGFDQANEVYDLLEQVGFANILIEKDIMGMDRIVYGKLI